MRPEMLEEYRTLIPQVPYIGGRRSPFSSALTMAAWTLAVYRVVVRHGGDAQDAGEVAFRYLRARIERIPKPIRPRPRKKRAQKFARWTQQRRYPHDWVAEYIDGAGQPFDFGIDYTECGAVKFLHAQAADELGPYMCAGDYALAEAMGAGLTRTETLAWGCDRCDFRWTVPGTTTAAWPPDFPERTCGRPDPIGQTWSGEAENVP